MELNKPGPSGSVLTLHGINSSDLGETKQHTNDKYKINIIVSYTEKDKHGSYKTTNGYQGFEGTA